MVNRDELIEVLNKIIKCEYDENEEKEKIIFFEANVPHPDGINLLYDSNQMTVEEIVDKALSYKPTILPQSPAK